MPDYATEASYEVQPAENPDGLGRALTNQLPKALAELEMTVENLEGRLGPILLPERAERVSAPNQNAMTEQRSRSELALALERAVGQVTKLSRRVSDIAQRVEL